LFMFMPAVWALTFIALGLIACTWLTLAPLTKRKMVEAAVQSARPDLASQADASRFDPLDRAANISDTGDHESEDTKAAKALALEALNKAEHAAGVATTDEERGTA